MTPSRHTYAEFLFADEEVPGQVCYSVQEVPPGHRDPRVPVLGGPPEEALGVRFFDLIQVTVVDPLTGKPCECHSERLNQSLGIAFYKGIVYRLEEVLAGKGATITIEDYTMVVTLMKSNGWEAIICLEALLLPFDLKQDQLLDGTP